MREKLWERQMEIQGLVLGKHWCLEDGKRGGKFNRPRGGIREMEGDLHENQLRREV